MTKHVSLSNLLNLPYDISRKIMIEELPVRDILNLCSINKKFNTNVCTEEFWQYLVNKRFNTSHKRGYITWKKLAVDLNNLDEIDQRLNDLIDYFKKINPNIKLSSTEGYEYFTIRNISTYPDRILFRIQIPTGNVFYSGSNKKIFNILDDPYGGKRNFSIESIENNEPRPREFNTGRIKNIPKYESKITLIPKEEGSHYTYKKLMRKPRDELVQIYKNMGFKNANKLNSYMITMAILSEK